MWRLFYKSGDRSSCQQYHKIGIVSTVAGVPQAASPAGTGRACHVKNRLSAWKLLVLKLEEMKKGEQSRLQRAAFKVRKQKQRRNRRAKEKMLDQKHHRSDIKEIRRDAWNDWRENLPL